MKPTDKSRILASVVPPNGEMNEAGFTAAGQVYGRREEDL
jgi:hypothetical protein